jgi:hypothetical protein
MQLHADWAITLGCGGACPYVPTMVEDWQIPDPAGLTLEQTRPIRELIDTKVKELIETRLDAIRSDGTAHAMRLQRLLPSLIDDFGAEKPAEEIRACADLMLQPFDDAPVRSFVLTLARRNAQECLPEGRCSDLAGASSN